jgi:1-aminocyclopropane-1-carboxylate deaminase/D-cysteine desulfhydrase-like pyridoxal-dependent ACC family enzyme
VERLPRAPLLTQPTPVAELSRLRDALHASPRLLIKRDDAIPFGFGGNKVRKLAFVAGRAVSDGADLLITCGGVQSNHARATAAAATYLGLSCALVANGEPPQRLTGNALLDQLLGARVTYVAGRDDRAPEMERLAADARRDGRRPFVIPLGASTPLGALGFVHAMAELAGQIDPPDVIVHATSSGGTQAGLVAGCRALGWRTRVLGISADEAPEALAPRIQTILSGFSELVPDLNDRIAEGPLEIDAAFVGEGYGIPTPESRRALERLARTEAIFLDPTYTSKAMAGLIAHLERGAFEGCRSVLFWHTGGQAGLFA